jgi:hypothetical protein
MERQSSLSHSKKSSWRKVNGVCHLPHPESPLKEIWSRYCQTAKSVSIFEQPDLSRIERQPVSAWSQPYGHRQYIGLLGNNLNRAILRKLLGSFFDQAAELDCFVALKTLKTQREYCSSDKESAQWVTGLGQLTRNSVNMRLTPNGRWIENL